MMTKKCHYYVIKYIFDSCLVFVVKYAADNRLAVSKYTQRRKVIPHFHSPASWLQTKSKNWKGSPYLSVWAIASVLGVSRHLNLLTSSWQDENVWQWTVGSSENGLEKTVLMKQMFFLTIFFSSYHKKWWLDLGLGSVAARKRSNVIPSLPVFSFSRSVNWGTVILKVPLFSTRLPGNNRP